MLRDKPHRRRGTNSTEYLGTAFKLCPMYRRPSHRFIDNTEELDHCFSNRYSDGDGCTEVATDR